MPDWLTIAIAVMAPLASGFGGAMAGARFVAAQYTQKLRKIDDLERRMQDNYEKRLQAVEKFSSKHAETCPARGIEHDLANALGWLKKIDGKLDQYSHETREQRAQIAAQGKWLENLDTAHNAHVRDREVHPHG